MAIQYARLTYVSRASGGSACRKAAYNERSRIQCERTGEVFYFKHKSDLFHHEIRLPQGVDKKFLDSKILWNEAERCERRKDSQVAKEVILALPDDAEVSNAMRLEIARQFADQLYVSQDLGVQLDIHAPHEGEHNWHAHLLITTRRFAEDGLSLSPKKARDLDPVVRYGQVKEGERLGEIARDIQNAVFAEHGLELRVDPVNLMGQEHLGPVRAQYHYQEAVERSHIIQEANEALLHNPEAILEGLTKHCSVFTLHDLDRFLNKHLPLEMKESMKQAVLLSPFLERLLDKETEQESSFYTTREVREEERKLLGLAEKVREKNGFTAKAKAVESVLLEKSFSEEQTETFRKATQEKTGVVIIQGRAGTGKSYLLEGVREAFKASKREVFGLAPTHTVAQDMRKAGFEASTVHSFLFQLKNEHLELSRKSVWIVDEAGMLGNNLLTELFKVAQERRAKVILVGDDKQLPSITRGGMFRELSSRFGACELSHFKRQEALWQKELSHYLVSAKMKEAVELLSHHDRLHLHETEEDVRKALVSLYSQESKGHEVMVLASRNQDVDAFNKMIHELRFLQGKLGDCQYEVLSSRGRIKVSEKDKILFTKTDKELGIMNGSVGSLEKVNFKATQEEGGKKEVEFIVKLNSGKEVSFNPTAFHGFALGYASTVHKAQGKTVEKTLFYHSGYGNAALSYVALTRQSKDLHLFASKEATKSEDHLAYQMSRGQGPSSSLSFDTRGDIEHREFMKEWERLSYMEKTKIAYRDFAKDCLFKLKEFFAEEKVQTIPSFVQEVSAPLPTQVERIDSLTVHKDWKELTRSFKESYYEALDLEEGEKPSVKEQAFCRKASERFADLVEGYRTLHQQDPDERQAQHLFKRAAFEERRYQEYVKDIDISRDISYASLYEERAKSERMARIEGGLYEDALKAGQAPFKEYSFSAYLKLRDNKNEFTELSKEAQERFKVSPFVAELITLQAQEFKERFDKEAPLEAYQKFKESALHQEEKYPRALELVKGLGIDGLEKQKGIAKNLLAFERRDLIRLSSVEYAKHLKEDTLLKKASQEYEKHFKEQDRQHIKEALALKQQREHSRGFGMER